MPRGESCVLAWGNLLQFSLLAKSFCLNTFKILLHKIIISFASLPFPPRPPSPPPAAFSFSYEFLFTCLVGWGGSFCIQKVLCELYVSHKYYAAEITTALTTRSNPSSPQHTTFCLLYKPWHSIITNLECIELL